MADLKSVCPSTTLAWFAQVLLPQFPICIDALAVVVTAIGTAFGCPMPLTVEVVAGLRLAEPFLGESPMLLRHVGPFQEPYHSCYPVHMLPPLT